MTDANNTRVRRRPRKIAITKTDKRTPTQKAHDLAFDFHTRNTEANAMGREAKAARDELYKLMKTHKLRPFNAVREIEDKTVSLDVDLETSYSYPVDVVELKKLVTEKQFMEIISATQTQVEKIAGKEVARRVTGKKAGNENVKVKVAK